MGQIWFTSDLHFCHERDFIWSPRGFKSIYLMNEAIIKNFSEVVSWEDDLYILGDCFLNNNEQGMRLMRQLPGKKHIIWGNHDTNTRQELMREEGFDCLGYAHQQKFNGQSFYLSHYPTLTANLDNDKPLSKRVINLSGHTHYKEKFYDGNPLIYNVAVDAHDCYPVNITTILDDIKKAI